jgi:P-type Cu+ transporter
MAGAAPAGVRELELSVQGMTCAACAARVETRLNKIAGVTATVSLATERARVAAPGGVPAEALAPIP